MLKKERMRLGKEKEHFNEFMEKEKVKLKQSEQKFKAEVSERNKTFFKRELSMRKNEDELLKLAELAEQNSEEESRLANFDSLIREAKREIGEARTTSIKDREADAEKNKIFFERELSIRKNEDKVLKLAEQLAELAEQLAELAEQNSEKKNRLRRATFAFLIREAKQRELQEKEEARIASEKRWSFPTSDKLMPSDSKRCISPGASSPVHHLRCITPRASP